MHHPCNHILIAPGSSVMRGELSSTRAGWVKVANDMWSFTWTRKRRRWIQSIALAVASLISRPLLRVRCFKVVGSLLSNQNTGMSENTTRIFIPHERSNSSQDFTTSSTRLVNTLDLRHLRPLPDTRNLSVTNTTSVDTSLVTSVTPE